MPACFWNPDSSSESELQTFCDPAFQIPDLEITILDSDSIQNAGFANPDFPDRGLDSRYDLEIWMWESRLQLEVWGQDLVNEFGLADSELRLWILDVI